MTPLEQSHLVPSELQTPSSLKYLSKTFTQDISQPSLCFSSQTNPEKPICFLLQPKKKKTLLEIPILSSPVYVFSRKPLSTPLFTSRQVPIFNHHHGRAADVHHRSMHLVPGRKGSSTPLRCGQLFPSVRAKKTSKCYKGNK